MKMVTRILQKKVYSINKNNTKLRQQTDEMFSEKFDDYISKYKNDEITYEEIKEYINKFIEYKDYSNKLEEVKSPKRKSMKKQNNTMNRKIIKRHYQYILN